nr:uncharacterized protein LOC127346619 [Lolium perenne]
MGPKGPGSGPEGHHQALPRRPAANRRRHHQLAARRRAAQGATPPPEPPSIQGAPPPAEGAPRSPSIRAGRGITAAAGTARGFARRTAPTAAAGRTEERGGRGWVPRALPSPAGSDSEGRAPGEERRGGAGDGGGPGGGGGAGAEP